MPDDDSLSEQIRQKIRLPIGKKDFRVFVFGPGMKPEEVVASPKSDVSTQTGLVEHAKYLRFHIAQKLREEGWTVDFGETESLHKFYGSLGIKNLAAMEITHGRKLCGAIIIFPASVGAICELGLFANIPELAEKTIAIVHAEYESHKSFFRVGLLKFFKIRRGTLEFEDYRDFSTCVQQAIDFVDDQWTNFNLEEATIADGELLALKRRGTNFEKSG